MFPQQSIGYPQLAFAEEAIVYDEKVEDGSTLERQRTRWIHSYFKYLAINWRVFLTGLKRFNFNLMFFGFTAIKPPLFITIGLAFACMVGGYFVNPWLSVAWGSIILIFITSFILIVLTQSRQKGMFKAILYIPVFVLRQVSALLKIKKAGKDFLKTEHIKVIYIEDLLQNEA